MSIKEVFFAKNVNVEKIKRGSATEKKIPFFYPLSGSEDYTNLVLQTPVMYIPFTPQEKKSNDGSSNWMLSLKNLLLKFFEVILSEKTIILQFPFPS